MLDRIEANGPAFDGMQDYGAHLVVDALLTAMVAMDERRKAIFTAFHDLIPGTTYVKPGESWSPELRSAFDRTMEEIKVIIDERRASPRPDFISDLVNARDAGDKLNDRELFDQIFGICGASLSATSRAAGGALYLLYTHDDQRAATDRATRRSSRRRSRNACGWAATAISPSRASPPATPRSAAPASSRAWWCGRRRSRRTTIRTCFPTRLRFDIHRKPKRILSFGAGPHHCIGNILGRTTITIAITRLLARFPKAHISDPNFTPVYGGAVGELRLQSLPMRTQ